MWQRFKILASLLVTLLALIDPRHIDELAARHPRWEAVILALWGVILSGKGRARLK